jgi:hypothetical protein
MSKAGTKSGGLAWLFAFASVAAALGVSWVASAVHLPSSVQYILYVGIIGAAAFASTYLTRASTGGGILAFLVASIAFAIGTYFLVSWMVQSATSALTTTVTTAAGAGADANAQQAAAAFGGAFGALAGILVAVLNGVVTIVAGITGAVIGGRAKKKALAESPSAMPHRLAA